MAEIRSNWCQNGDKQEGILIKRNVSMYFERSYITEVLHGQRMFNTLVACSNPTDSSSQLPKNKEVTNLKENGNTSEKPELVFGLFFESQNDPDLKLILQRWPELPEHIKLAIKALIQTHRSNP